MNMLINKPWVSSCLPIHEEFKILCLVSVLKSVFELQLLFDAVVMKEFMTVFAQWIRLLYRTHKYTWKINYTLGGGEIHGKHVEPSFNFVHPCIGKL